MRVSHALKILDLPPDARLEDAKSAFRSLAKQFHPDRLVGSGILEGSDVTPEDAEIRMKEINLAYRALSKHLKPGRRVVTDRVDSQTSGADVKRASPDPSADPDPQHSDKRSARHRNWFTNLFSRRRRTGASHAGRKGKGPSGQGGRRSSPFEQKHRKSRTFSSILSSELHTGLGRSDAGSGRSGAGSGRSGAGSGRSGAGSGRSDGARISAGNQRPRKRSVDYHHLYSGMRQRMKTAPRYRRASPGPIEEITPVSRVTPVSRK